VLRAELAMTGRVYNVLFLCTHNSARSIMAEVIMNDFGRGKFKGYSAGSHPASAPNPFALETLRRSHLPADGLYSKNWEEFAKPDAPIMDFVVTVCDNAAGEVCPYGPGNRLVLIGASRTLPCFVEPTKQSVENLLRLPTYSGAASNSSPACHSKSSID
jgi:protein-tyrosine-phosphatase